MFNYGRTQDSRGKGNSYCSVHRLQLGQYNGRRRNGPIGLKGTEQTEPLSPSSDGGDTELCTMFHTLKMKGWLWTW